MNRRDLLIIGSAAIALPLAALAQPQGGMRRLGALLGSLASDPNWQARAAVFVQGLGTLGSIEGTNLRIDWRWAGSDAALYERYAAELVSLGPDVLLCQGSPSVAALRRQTSTIPIVLVSRGGAGRAGH